MMLLDQSSERSTSGGRNRFWSKLYLGVISIISFSSINVNDPFSVQCFDAVALVTERKSGLQKSAPITPSPKALICEYRSNLEKKSLDKKSSGSAKTESIVAL